MEKAVTAPTSVLPEETAPVAAPGETATTGTDETTPDPEHAVAGRAVTCSNGGDAGGSAGLHAGYVLVSADALAATKAMCSLKNGGATTSTSMRSKDKKLVLGSTADNKEVSVVCNQVFIDKRDSGDDIYASGLATFAPRVKDKCIGTLVTTYANRTITNSHRYGVVKLSSGSVESFFLNELEVVTPLQHCSKEEHAAIKKIDLVPIISQKHHDQVGPMLQARPLSESSESSRPSRRKRTQFKPIAIEYSVPVGVDPEETESENDGATTGDKKENKTTARKIKARAKTGKRSGRKGGAKLTKSTIPTKPTSPTSPTNLINHDSHDNPNNTLLSLLICKHQPQKACQ